MTFKRKLAVTTIAASVAMSAFAGIPLSSKGLSEKLGFNNVAYATNLSDLITKSDKLYTELVKDTEGLEAVNQLKGQLQTALADGTIVSGLVAKIAKGNSDISDDLQGLLIELLSNVIPNDAEDTFEYYAGEYAGLLGHIRTTHGLTALSVEDLASVILQLQVNFSTLLVDINLDNILTIKDQLKAAATNAIASNTNVATLAGPTKADITGEDLADIYVGLQNSSVSNTTVIAAYNALNKAYKAAFPSTPPWSGGIYVPPATIDIPAEVKELEKKFEELAEKLENASDEEKAELIAEAIAEAQALIDKLSDLSTSVTVSGDVATLKLDENKALAAIAGIGAVVEALEEATGATIENLDVTVDFGNVAQDNLVIALSDAVMKKAVEVGLTGIILKVSGLEVKLPVGGTFSNAVDFKINKSEATEEVTGGLQAASDVFEFILSVGGKSTTTFSNPIQIVFPLGDTTGLDTELLTVAKLLKDGLEFHGGRVKGKTIIESRDSFSSYVVVENSVSFDDTASVDAWAGRAIEVIAAKGVIHGKLEGQFDPSAKVTRAQFAKMLVRALDLNNQAAKEKFADVEDDAWYAPYIAAASENGIIYGRSATRFDPHAEVTRAEMATMVARGLKATSGAADIEDVEKALQAFADAEQINETLKQGVAFAAEHSIVVGNGGKFAPNASATRAQAAVIIYRAFNFEV
ncbi:S-layer protein [Paenibacillus agaridevorans]|uniref:S-layer protein n=1 Tax=Paenibacillus agaridevorans TaxID=171404 RepID=A0A2R5ETS4_9BACL|nr:S-layer homology domain-containing protein [Paenibacillus agaridevorans]GBG09545.1 S-layer protein [Paenibacillus agaridevorans]